MRFSHLLTAAFVAAAMTAPAFAQHITTGGKFDLDFDEVDANRDGLLSVEEFSAVLPPGVSKSLAAVLIRQADADGDQKVTQAEMMEMASAGPRPVVMLDLAVLAPFALVDLNGDGKVTLAELDLYGEEPIAGFHAMYARAADKDRDGGVSTAEWDAARATVSVTASVTKD